MAIYTIKKEILKYFTDYQLENYIKGFSYNDNGDIIIPYEHKGYTVNNKEIEFSNVKAISMFSGAGGLDIGTQLAKVKVISSMDIFEDSVKTIKNNSFFSNAFHENNDITKIDGKHFSELLKQENPEKLIVVGGPPCQPFSKAGYWVTNEKRNSSDDPRNLLKPYFKLLNELKPDGFVLENVESILHPSNKDAIDTIHNEMAKLGYHFSMIKANAAEYGIPQKRKRVFFLASKKK